MKKLVERMPPELKDKIPPLVVFAPSPAVEGEDFLLPALPASDEQSHLIYLAPSLERRSQADVDSTVAHEFAHAILRSSSSGHGPSADDPLHQKREADDLIEAWGYRPTNSRGWMRRSTTSRPGGDGLGGR